MIKILFINVEMHFKNLHALKKYNFCITYINNANLDMVDLDNIDVVYSPTRVIDVKKYPNTKFIFGPHFSVFPNKAQMDIISGNNAIYIQPSDWVRNVWRNNSLCNNIRIKTLPFGVDTEMFSPINQVNERIEVFVYFKRRKISELIFLISFLKSKGIQPKIFNYVNKYSEQEYLQYLKNSKYGIWLDAHESQGFALEEALSCDVPLLVWNVTSLNQEYNSNYPNLPATTIPYWDKRCGEYFYNETELDETFNKFINNLDKYKPREYVKENISIEQCCNKFIELYNKI
jgi:glycosyltransferase involved in cell wall biosynthesis